MNRRPRNLLVLSTGRILKIADCLTLAALIGSGALLTVMLIRTIFQH